MDEAKCYPVPLIISIRSCDIEGSYVSLALVVNICYHVAQLYTRLIAIHVYPRIINFEELVIKIILNLTILWEITFPSNGFLKKYGSHEYLSDLL